MDIILTALIYNDNTIGAKGERPDFVGQHASYISDLRHRFVLIGRKTFEAMGKPKLGTRTFVFSRNHEYQSEGVTTILDLAAFIKIAAEAGESEVVVFGGAQTFHAAMPWADKLSITWVHRNREGEMKFPQFPPHFHCPAWDTQEYDVDGVLLESMTYYRWNDVPFPSETLEDQAMLVAKDYARRLTGKRPLI